MTMRSLAVIRRSLAMTQATRATARFMSSNRNHPISGVSNETNITEEVRDLIRNAKTAENIDEWEGQDRFKVVKTFRPNHKEDMDDDQHFDIKYWPMEGEEIRSGVDAGPAPLVLIAERMEKVSGEPYWHRETMEKLGLGKSNGYRGKKIAVPNMTYYTSLVRTPLK